MQTDPKDFAEYQKLVWANQKITGFGADVKTHFPCPFCAAPEWLVQPITDGIDDYPIMKAGATCQNCGRSAKFIFKRGHGSLEFELVQSGGPAAPDWLEPKIRRIDA